MSKYEELLKLKKDLEETINNKDIPESVKETLKEELNSTIEEIKEYEEKDNDSNSKNSYEGIKRTIEIATTVIVVAMMINSFMLYYAISNKIDKMTARDIYDPNSITEEIQDQENQYLQEFGANLENIMSDVEDWATELKESSKDTCNTEACNDDNCKAEVQEDSDDNFVEDEQYNWNEDIYEHEYEEPHEHKHIFIDDNYNGPKIGIIGSEYNEDGKTGVLVNEVMENSGAIRAGIRENDLIVSVDGIPVRSIGDMRRITSNHSNGDYIEVKLRRYPYTYNDLDETLLVELGE